jgi:hypothetical protein
MGVLNVDPLEPRPRAALTEAQLVPLLRCGCPPDLLRETLWRFGMVPPRREGPPR